MMFMDKYIIVIFILIIELIYIYIIFIKQINEI